MYCTHCGKEIHDEAVICVHCGVPTGYVPAPAPAATPTPKPVKVPPRKGANPCAIVGFVLSVITIPIGFLLLTSFYSPTNAGFTFPELIIFLLLPVCGLFGMVFSLIGLGLAIGKLYAHGLLGLSIAGIICPVIAFLLTGAIYLIYGVIMLYVLLELVARILNAISIL